MKLPDLYEHRRNIIAGLSLANLCFLRAWSEIFGVRLQSYYVAITPLDRLALFLNVLLVGFFLAAVLIASEATTNRWVKRFTLVFMTLLALIPLDAVRVQFLELSFSQIRRALLQPAIALAVIAGFAAAIWALRHWHVRLMNALTGILLIFSPLIVFTFWAAARPRASGATENSALRSSLSTPAPNTRLVVAVFDELDQYVTFEARPADVSLPAFDALSAAALRFPNAESPSDATSVAIPAMLLGEPLTSARPRSTDDLEVFAQSTSLGSWSTRPNLLTATLDRGLGVGIVGWYHPYCRLFPAVSTCYWEPAGLVSHGDDRSLVRAMGVLFTTLTPMNSRVRHRHIYENTVRAATAAVGNERLGLVFLHLPVPHRPWIYDRSQRRHTLVNTRDDGYLDNLVLADETLMLLRAELQRSGLADRTVLIVTADHGLRATPLGDPQRRNRVPFLVHLPGQPRETVVQTPISTVALRQLSEAILEGVAGTHEAIVRSLTSTKGSADHP